MPRYPRFDLLALVLLAIVTRSLLVASGSVSFHSDEAIVALMARHMLQGDFPVFFYGQAYMGSFNALSTALGFAVMGESVVALRVVQIIKFALVVGTGHWAAWHLSGRRTVAAVAGLMLAVPPTLGAIYTATNIGGYAETLIFGHLLLVLGYDVAHTHPDSLTRWVLLGLVAGLAWWTNALIVAFALPVALLILWTAVRRAERKPRYIALIGVALVCFFVGGAPFWIYDVTHNHAALAMFLPSTETPLNGVTPIDAPFQQKVLGLGLFAIPTIVGMRHTWATAYFLPWVGLPVLLIYIAALYQLIRAEDARLWSGARFLVVGVPALLLVVFLSSSFGADPTGRYFLPVQLSLGMAVGTLTARLRENISIPGLWLVPVLLIVGYNAAGQTTVALENDPGMTTQFDLVTHIPNTHDDALLDFLARQDIQHGYASYWLGPRLAFLSGERVQLSAALPYKPNLTYNPADNRYPPYQQATENADRVAYINVDRLPELDPVLQRRFAAAGVTYDVERIGPFIVYYDFQPRPPRLDFAANPVNP